jgi:hypothetical protein
MCLGHKGTRRHHKNTATRQFILLDKKTPKIPKNEGKMK